MSSHATCLEYPGHRALKEEAVRFRGDHLRDGDSKEMGCLQKWLRDG